MTEQEIKNLIRESEISGLNSQVEFLEHNITITLAICTLVVTILSFVGGYVLKGIKKQHNKAKEAINEAKTLHENAQEHIDESKRQREELKEQQSEITNKQKELKEYSENLDKKREKLEMMINSKKLDDKLKQIDGLLILAESVEDKMLFERNLGNVKAFYDSVIAKSLPPGSSNEKVINFENKIKEFENANYAFQALDKKERVNILNEIESLRTEMHEFLIDMKKENENEQNNSG